ncbi:MAG: 16S rRNA (cytosine(1402)-N(4))-methyltransferase RsmH [Myxococcota bacterium]
MIASHLPVMLSEVLQALAPGPGDRIVDATLGLGGHAEKILERIAPGGVLIGIDRDPEMLERARERLSRFGDAVRLVRARLSHLADAVRGTGLAPVHGVLFDLGVCSAQLDDPERGLSFLPANAEAPLDMRLDRSRGETARAWLGRVGEPELVEVLRRGDVPAARRVARALLAASPLATTGDLTAAVQQVRLPERRHHPATLVFQALRIEVNQELSDLERGLECALEILESGGRLVVIAYHSGEDRRVKTFLQRELRGCICPPDLPRCGCGRSPRLRRVARRASASPSEIRLNRRARSARLRAAEKR